MSTLNNIKKMGRPPVDSEAITLRVHRQQLDDIDDWRSAQRPIPTRPEAIRRLAAAGLGALPIVTELLAYLETLPPGPELDSTIAKLRGIVLP